MAAKGICILGGGQKPLSVGTDLGETVEAPPAPPPPEPGSSRRQLRLLTFVLALAVALIVLVSAYVMVVTTGPDADRDGLTEQRERQLGTDPADPDTDGDAIPDGVEVDMKRYDLSLTDPPAVDLDLDGNGESDANPLVRDLFMEVDHMEDYRISIIAEALAQKPFRESPVGRIVLHIDQIVGGNAVPSTPCIGLAPAVRDTFFDLKAAHFAPARKGVFHYAILANKVPPNADCADDVLGQALANDDDFVLAFERLQFQGESQIAAVFMHELGHNLGLVGDTYPGVDNECTLPGSPCFDPDLYSNYRSVMNYRFQRGFGASGLGGWVIDYSDGMNGPDGYGHPDYNDWGHLDYEGIRTPD